jgi:hypothetical protein
MGEILGEGGTGQADSGAEHTIVRVGHSPKAEAANTTITPRVARLPRQQQHKDAASIGTFGGREENERSWADVVESDSPTEKRNSQGLLTSLKGAGLEAEPSGGWTTLKPIHDEEDQEALAERIKIVEEELMIEREKDIARLQKSSAKGGGEIAIEQTLDITQPSQGNGWKASPGNKRSKGAKGRKS